jgi:hypothetical protein
MVGAFPRVLPRADHLSLTPARWSSSTDGGLGVRLMGQCRRGDLGVVSSFRNVARRRRAAFSARKGRSVAGRRGSGACFGRRRWHSVRPWVLPAGDLQAAGWVEGVVVEPAPTDFVVDPGVAAGGQASRPPLDQEVL